MVSDLTIKGIVTGFLLSIMIGPVFFVLLETSIRRGIRAALALDFGVLLSDVLYIAIAYVFYSEVSSLTTGANSGILKLVGGILFVTYGVATYFKKIKDIQVDAVGNVIQQSSDYFKLALKGFLLNLANPLVIFYWFSVMTLAAKESNADGHQDVAILYFLNVILVTYFTVDFFKIIGAKKLRPLVTNKLLIALNHLIGILFVCFGIFLILKGML